MCFRNAYQNNCLFKIEDFPFKNLFEIFSDVEKILLLIRALLLEKKVIFVKEDISDVAILMQALLVML